MIVVFELMQKQEVKYFGIVKLQYVFDSTDNCIGGAYVHKL